MTREFPATSQWSIWHCRPYFYGVQVAPGQSYFASEFNEQHLSPQGEALWGVAIPPSDDDLTDWAVELRSIYKEGTDPEGGWSPVRSSVCLWGGYQYAGPQERYFYKAERASFDGGYFMLMHQFDLVVNGQGLSPTKLQSGFHHMAERLGLYQEICEEFFRHEPSFQRSKQERDRMWDWLGQTQLKDLALLETWRMETNSICEALQRKEMWNEVDKES